MDRAPDFFFRGTGTQIQIILQYKKLRNKIVKATWKLNMQAGEEGAKKLWNVVTNLLSPF